jgi:hypothetical protein
MDQPKSLSGNHKFYLEKLSNQTVCEWIGLQLLSLSLVYQTARDGYAFKVKQNIEGSTATIPTHESGTL